MINTLITTDQQLTTSIQNFIPHNHFFNSFFSFFSLYGASIFIWLLVIIFIIIVEEIQRPGIQKIDRVFIFYLLLNFGVVYFLNEFILKNIFQRLRPSSFNCPMDFSFPSSHAICAFAAATTIAYFDKKRWWLYYTIAFLISFSRIYLGCHWFFDVLVGGLLGFFISQVILLTRRSFASPGHTVKRH